jgi:hypothetical protein
MVAGKMGLQAEECLAQTDLHPRRKPGDGEAFQQLLEKSRKVPTMLHNQIQVRKRDF